jgi:hypothetical protein
MNRNKFYNFKLILSVAAIFSMCLVTLNSLVTVKADGVYFSLAVGTPLTQNWTNTGLITTNDDWSGVPSINGYTGDVSPNNTNDADPRTLLTDLSAAIDVNANQANPNTFNTGGVTEFDGIANPTIGLQGSGSADTPHIDIRLDTTACIAPNSIALRYVVRDIDGSTDNAAQQVNAQYRVGSTGNYTNISNTYIPDATTGPNLATLTTPVAALLPNAALGQAQVHIRIMTTNAAANDEVVGIDDINISCSVATAANGSISGRVTAGGRGITRTMVMLSGGNLNEPLYATTNSFGNYNFSDIPVGENYVVTVMSKKYSFANPSIVISLNENISDADFIAEER